MGKISKSFALMFLLVFVASVIALPQNVKAPLTISLNATEITDTSVTLYWTSDKPPASFVPIPGHPFFDYYTLRMSNKTFDPQTPLYGVSNYEDIWTSTDSQQTITTIANLSSSTTYHFYILAADYLGGAFSNIVEVQTLPSPTSSPTPTSTASPSPTPTVPEFPWLAILPLFLSMLSIALIVFSAACPSRFLLLFLVQDLIRLQVESLSARKRK